MAVFYSNTELAEMSGKLIEEATRLPTIREGIERAIAEQPQFGRLFPSMARPSIDRTSRPAAVTDNESVKQLFEEITTAFNEEAFEKVIETVDQAFTTRSANWSRMPDSSIALAFLKKATAHEKRGESEAAIEAYDEVITRFSTSDEPNLQVRVAWALSNKGDVQRQRGEFEAAIEAYDEVITRFDNSDEPDLQVRVAWVLSDKGDVQGQRGEFEAAIEAYDEVITRFDNSDEPNLQVPVAWALSQKGMRQIEMDLAEEALNTCGELELRLGTLTENEKNDFTWRAMCVRALALLVQERHQAAMDTFRSAYAVFVPSNEMMMYEMQRIVPELVATGASAHDLVKILSSDKEKSGTLAPLIVALRQHTGEEVRAPVEVLEVAADIRERIEAKAAKGASVVS